MTFKKILLIDDNTNALNILRVILKGEGYEVFSAVTGELGITTAHEEKPDVILLDIGLPGMSGFEVCEKLKSDPETKDITVIIVTSDESAENQKAAMEKMADGFLVKPYEIEDLIGQMLELLKEKDNSSDS